MKLQENTQKAINLHQKEGQSNGSDFKQKIPNYINEINLSTFLLDQNEFLLQPLKITKKVHFETQKNMLRSQISTTLQTATRFFLFLGRSMMENYSEIIVYEYMKANGQHNSLIMNGIKGQISCMVGKFSNKRKKDLNKKSETIKNNKKSLQLKNSHQSGYEIVLLIGTVEGYLKTLRFSDIQQSDQPKFVIESVKLDYCEIVHISGLDSSYYGGANVCLALSVTNRVYLVNLDNMDLIACFFPTILSCEVGLQLSINYEEQYFIQSCEGGYIIFWDLNEKILELINKSVNKTKIQLQEKLFQDMMAQQNKQNQKSSKQIFRSSDIYHAITPLNIFHTATISGLKYCQLYGNLLLIITQGGIIKLLAISKQSFAPLCQNQYTSLFEYQIEDGHLVTDVKFFPQNMEIFIAKSWVLDDFVKKNGFQKHMPIKEYQIEKQSLKKKKKPQNTKVYKPLRMKTVQNNIIPQRVRSKSSDNNHNKCYFERIIFNSQLQIERVDKIHPSIHIDCIESIQMTNQKDIIVLRAREFYLIGQIDLFSGINVN